MTLNQTVGNVFLMLGLLFMQDGDSFGKAVPGALFGSLLFSLVTIAGSMVIAFPAKLIIEPVIRLWAKKDQIPAALEAVTGSR